MIITRAHEEQSTEEHLRHEHVIPRGSFVVSAVFVNLLHNCGFNPFSIVPAFLLHLRAFEKEREAVKSDDVA